MKILKGKNKILFLAGLVILVCLIPQLGFADFFASVAKIISSAVLGVVNFLVGWLISLLIKVFVWIAQYNDFIGSAAVSKGWIIIRDILNMFFVIALLIVAFSTVLGVQRYHYKNLLPSLLIAAVLVNFSKLICGIFIDISQILMLTFVSAFKDVAGGNLIEMMGLQGLLDLKNAGGVAEDIGAGEILGATLLALIMAAVSVVVLGVIVMILIFRIIWLWFLIVLSPFAFVASAFPGQMKGYSSQWWSKFTKQVIVGPVLAFCLWLSFAVVQEGDLVQGANIDQSAYQAEGAGASEQQISTAASPQYILNFMLGIGMLVGSLMVAESLGVAGAGLATKAKNNLEAYAKGKKGPLKTPKKVAKGVAKGAGKVALKAPGRLVGGGLKGLGRKMQKGRAGGVMQKAGKIVKGAGEPIKNIHALKGNIAKSFRKNAEKRKERIKEGKGTIIDKAINAMGEDFKSGGFSDRQALSAAHLEKIEAIIKRLEDQGADSDRLKYLSDNGTQAEGEAAAIMLAKRGDLKNDKEAFELSDKRISAGNNKELMKRFRQDAKKNVDPKILYETIYNGLKGGMENIKDIISDIKSGDLDAAKFFTSLNDGQMNSFVDKDGNITEIFEQLDEDKFMKMGTKMQKTKQGKERLNTLSEDMDTSKLQDEKSKQKFIKGTGRIDIAHKDSDDNIDSAALKDFISNNKNIVLEHSSEKAMENEEVVRAMLESDNIKQKDIEKLNNKSKKAFLTKSEEILSEFNTNMDTSDIAKKTRKIYAKMTNNISKAFENMSGELEKAIEKEEIKVDDIAKHKTDDISDETLKVLSKKLIGAEVIDLARKNGRLAQRVVNQRVSDRTVSEAEKNTEWIDTSGTGRGHIITP